MGSEIKNVTVPLVGTLQGVDVTDEHGNTGKCTDGSYYYGSHTYFCEVIDKSNFDGYYYAFDLSGDSLSGHYTEDGWGDEEFAILSGSKSTGGTGGDTPVGDYTYTVPYSPMDGVYSVGFGVSNVDNDSTTDVYIEYFTNNGVKLGQDVATLSARGHTVFMRGVAMSEPGWAKVTATQPIYGTALVFAPSGEKMLDEVFSDTDNTSLTIAQWATNAGWISKACLANPNGSSASVSITLYPSTAHSQQTYNITIPALGAAQLDIGFILSDASGTAKITSSQGLVGFLLYTNPAGTGYHGGLAIEASH